VKKPSSASWEHGAKVCIADIQDEAGQQLRDTLGGGDVAMFVHCDVTVEEDVSAAGDAAAGPASRATKATDIRNVDFSPMRARCSASTCTARSS
jgi:xanthoxin dehydrogenase